MLISIPTGTSTIFGAFQAISTSPMLRRECRTGVKLRPSIEARKRASVPFAGIDARKRTVVGNVPQIWRKRAAPAPLSAAVYNGCHLTIAHAGALISHSPTAGVHPLELGASQGGFHEVRFDDDGGNHVAGRLARCSATCATCAAERARNAGCHAPDGKCRRLARNPADRPEGRPGQAEPDQDQAAGGLPHFALRAGAGCPPHRGRPAGGGDLRGHAQIESLGGDRPLPRRRGRRGQGIRADPAEKDSQRRLLLEGRLPLHRRAEPGAGICRGRVLL